MNETRYNCTSVWLFVVFPTLDMDVQSVLVKICQHCVRNSQDHLRSRKYVTKQFVEYSEQLIIASGTYNNVLFLYKIQPIMTI